MALLFIDLSAAGVGNSPDINPVSLSLSLLLSLVLCFSLCSLAIIAGDSKDDSTLLLCVPPPLPSSPDSRGPVSFILYASSADQFVSLGNELRFPAALSLYGDVTIQQPTRRRCSVAFVISFFSYITTKPLS